MGAFYYQRSNIVPNLMTTKCHHSPPAPSLLRIEGVTISEVFAISPLSLVREGMSRCQWTPSDRGEC